MRKFYVLFILLYLSTGCFTTPSHVREAHSLMSSFTRKMKNEGFDFVGSGGKMREAVKEISLCYCISKKFSIDQSRIFFIKYAEDLLERINSTERIQPYLYYHPFESKNIDFSIRFIDNKGTYVEEPYIAYMIVDTSNDEIVYYIYNREKKELEWVHSELYQDALRIYQESLKPFN